MTKTKFLLITITLLTTIKAGRTTQITKDNKKKIFAVKKNPLFKKEKEKIIPKIILENMRITRSHGKVEDNYKLLELPINKRKKVIANKKQNEIPIEISDEVVFKEISEKQNDMMDVEDEMIKNVPVEVLTNYQKNPEKNFEVNNYFPNEQKIEMETNFGNQVINNYFPNNQKNIIQLEQQKLKYPQNDNKMQFEINLEEEKHKNQNNDWEMETAYTMEDTQNDNSYNPSFKLENGINFDDAFNNSELSTMDSEDEFTLDEEIIPKKIIIQNYNRFEEILVNQKNFELQNSEIYNKSQNTDSNGLFTFGIELESAKMVSLVADPDSDDHDNAYINCDEWYMFNDSNKVFEMATKKGYSYQQIIKIAYEIQLVWLKMISLTPKSSNKKYEFKKGDVIVTIGEKEIKANRDFGIKRGKMRIPWLSPQITMKLPLNRIKKLFTFFLNNNDNKEHTAKEKRGKKGPRIGGIGKIIKKIYDLDNKLYDNGLTNLWLFYSFTLFYTKNEITQIKENGESITIDINANDGSLLEFGPKQNVKILSRIGFYEMYHKMTPNQQQNFIKNADHICKNLLNCENLIIERYKNTPDAEDSLFHGNIIHNNLTLTKWTNSIINGDPSFKNQTKLDLQTGKNITVGNTDMLSPPLGFRSSFEQENSDYDESKGVDRLYGMGCMSNIEDAVVDGVRVRDVLALLEFRDYANNKMEGDYVVEYLESEIGGIMEMVRGEDGIII